MTEHTLLPSDLWSNTVQIAKLRVNSRSLWETLEKTAGIALDGDTLIVGLSPGLFNLAGHMNASDHRNAIENALSEVAGRRMKFRVIEGSTPADWISVQERDRRVAEMRKTTQALRDRQSEAVQAWEVVYENAARTYSATPMRQLPQGKARYLADMLYALSDAVDELMADEPDETASRQLARIIDRVATNADVPATLVALELERLRTWTKSHAG